MKSETAPRPGIVDALGTGLVLAGQRPWLLLIPAFVDFWLWLAPPVHARTLIQTGLSAFETLLARLLTPAQSMALAPLLQELRAAAAQLQQADLAEGLTGGWLGANSVLAQTQVTRMTFISDLVLAPAGMARAVPQVAPAPWQAAGIEVAGPYALLAIAGFWLAGQIIVATYMWCAGASVLRAPAAGPTNGRPQPVSLGWRALVVRLAAFALLVSCAMLVLRLPLLFALTLLVSTNNAILAMLSLLFGGLALWLTLWFLLAIFFVNESLLLERQPLGRSLTRSVALVHRNFGAALGLAALINLLMYGFHIVWGLMVQSPAGVALAIVANAYLATAMLLATFAFYASLRRAAVTQQAKATN